MGRSSLKVLGGALLDAAYLVSLWFVVDLPWLSYFLVSGLIAGFVAGKRVYLGRTNVNPALIGVAPILPFSLWNLSAKGEETRLSKTEETANGSAAPINAAWVTRTLDADKNAKIGIVIAMSVLLLGTITNVVGDRVVNPALAPVDNAGEQYLNRAVGVAALSFGTARFIDRSISVASETEVGVGFASTKPGQRLKPIQDMVVRYADFMVFAMVSLGVQRVGIEIAQVGAVPVVASVALLLAMASVLSPVMWRPRLVVILRTAVVLFVVFRLGIPIIATATGAVSMAVLDDRREQVQAEVDPRGEQVIDDEVPADVDEDVGFVSFMRELGDQAADEALAVRHYTEGFVERFIELLVIYVIEIILVPLVLLVILWKLAKGYIAPARTIIGNEWSSVEKEIRKDESDELPVSASDSKQ